MKMIYNYNNNYYYNDYWNYWNGMCWKSTL